MNYLICKSGFFYTIVDTRTGEVVYRGLTYGECADWIWFEELQR